MTHALPVVAFERLPDDMVFFSVDVAGTPLAAGYRHVGQFVTLATEASPPGFFAIASPPGRGRFDFLIKIEHHKPKTAELGKRAVGDTLIVGDVQGEGYPLAAQRGRDLLLVATGTGIAPIRALLGEIAPVRRDYGAVTLVYGAARQAALAFAGEHAAWQAMGVRFIPCLSRPEAGWAGARGYVQDVLAGLDLAAPAATTAFLCGQKAMTEKAAALLRGRGLPADRIFENE